MHYNVINNASIYNLQNNINVLSIYRLFSFRKTCIRVQHHHHHSCCYRLFSGCLSLWHIYILYTANQYGNIISFVTYCYSADVKTI